MVDAAGAPADLPPADIDPDDDACIFYTSGTTGPPKGARTTHRGSMHNLINLAFIKVCGDVARERRQADPDAPPTQARPEPLTALVPVPLFHVTGCTCVLHPVTATGGRLVLMHHWDAAEALRLVERERVTTFTGVPTMAREVLRHPDWTRTDTSSLHSMGGGGAALQPDLVTRIDGQLEHGRPNTGYGLTETTGIATAISSEFYVARPSSVGPVVPCMEAKVPDDRLGEEVAAAVVLGPGADLDEAGLAAHLTGRLARFKHPRHVWFLDEPLPRNANGKFLKRELRERLAPPA